MKSLFFFKLIAILEKDINISRSPSVEASSILNGFLNKNPVDRLGCRIQTGFADITNHPFFKTLDWEMVSILLEKCDHTFFISITNYNRATAGEETSGTALRASFEFKP